MRYYSLRNILKKEATYNMIIGERSNGKTYACLKYCLEKYVENGEQFAIIRRWKEDITGRRASDIFSALNENGVLSKLTNGEFTGVKYYRGKFYRCTYDDKTGKALFSIDSDCIGYCFALSDTEHNKSVSYPLINNIVFDEFLTKGSYFPDEFVLFMNTLSTIIRQREGVKIFMLGNTVNKYCPYFKEMGLNNIAKQKQGTIDVYRYGSSELTVAVEYCKSLSRSKKNNYYFAFDNPKLEMIKSGAWELDIFPHLPIKYKPKDVKFTYVIEFEDKMFECNIIKKEEYFFTYIHNKTTPIKPKTLVYSFDYPKSKWYNNNILKAFTPLENKILYFFKSDSVFYQDNEVGTAIQNYLKICKRG